LDDLVADKDKPDEENTQQAKHNNCTDKNAGEFLDHGSNLRFINKGVPSPT
jgi:hypothetical protein